MNVASSKHDHKSKMVLHPGGLSISHLLKADIGQHSCESKSGRYFDKKKGLKFSFLKGS